MSDPRSQPPVFCPVCEGEPLTESWSDDQLGIYTCPRCGTSRTQTRTAADTDRDDNPTDGNDR